MITFKQGILVSFVLLVAGGCATLPTGPSVNVLPAPGKPFETFRTEDATCRQWAEQHLGVSPQKTYESNVATGAVAGTAIGAGVGAAVGSASGHAGAGALIGGAYGLLVGSAVGSNSGQVYGREAQRRYDNAYVQCMYSYGNQVPGYRAYAAAAPPQPQPVAPPPPPPPSSPEAYPEEGQYPPPPEVYVDESPQFIYSPELNLYVAVGVPYDLVYTGSGYFYFYGGHWYGGRYYNGPWQPAAGRYAPPVLRNYRIDQIRYYRDTEFRRYDHDRAHYNGRIHRPEYRGDRRKQEHRREH
jgi:hypothetical protein